ncbi:anti-sigma factor antagonist [Hyunsoonleella ulvae]|uniref:anti-sigma factor antagonist n=1 Tax=Hyunsoonleella ulvae TaxID=2799948 RepID=UPI00193A8193|nr:anti-sigma factor antagonist [Hyunsoonleella ulvae]
MDLKITTCNNFFKLKGVLNKSNTSVFKKKIYDAIDANHKLTVSIDALEAIDAHAVESFRNAYFYAKNLQKEFTIVGVGCKELYDYFQSYKVAS